MKQIRITVLLTLCCLLTGCAALLEREYVVVEPHSGRFWESEAADILRAETYQDVVNDLLLLVSQHTESATLRLYNFNSDTQVSDALERAAREVRQETPLGAYAVDDITTFSQAQRGYYEVTIHIGYRRTAEQMQLVVNTTSAGAVYSLLESALDNGARELAVRIGYWDENSQLSVEESVRRLQREREGESFVPWVIHYYPATGNVGLVEILTAENAVAEEAFIRESVLPGEEEPATEATASADAEAMPDAEKDAGK